MHVGFMADMSRPAEAAPGRCATGTIQTALPGPGICRLTGGKAIRGSNGGRVAATGLSH